MFVIVWYCQRHRMGHGQHINLKWIWMDGCSGTVLAYCGSLLAGQRCGAVCCWITQRTIPRGLESQSTSGLWQNLVQFRSHENAFQIFHITFETWQASHHYHCYDSRWINKPLGVLMRYHAANSLPRELWVPLPWPTALRNHACRADVLDFHADESRLVNVDPRG